MGAHCTNRVGWAAIWVALASASLATFACGDKKPTQNPQPFVQPVDAGPQFVAAPVDAGPPPPPSDGWAGTAQRIDPALAALAVAPVSQLARTDAPGMAPEAAPQGTLMAANFQQGQTLESPVFNMVPGKCYSVVAAGAGIQQLDITMLVVTPLPGVQAPFGTTDKKPTPFGSTAVLGAKSNCVKLALAPFPMQVKFVVVAAKGAGLAAVQLLSK
jgi:hypothetical protein